MKDTDPGRRGELTDAQLDQLLAETNRELLEHVEATSDPSRTLAAIMARNAEQGRPGQTSSRGSWRAALARRRAAYGLRLKVAAALLERRAVSHNAGQALAAIMRSRMRASAAARILIHEAERPNPGRGSLAIARELARQLARDRELRRVLTSDRDITLAYILRDTLDRASGLVRELEVLARASGLPGSAESDVARARAGDLNHTLRDWLTGARSIALALVSALDAPQVDVSGADLSRMDINPDLLNGAIWTDQTSWPPGVASRIRPHSTEIRPGVYQVRLGNTPDRDFLTLS